MKFQVTFWVIICLAFNACNPGVEVNPKDIAKQYAVTCFISPQDTILKAYMYKGRGLGQGVGIKELVVNDAQIEIMSATQKVNLVYNLLTSRYEINAKSFAIKSGQTYTLRAKALDGTLITGTCQIPKPAPAIVFIGDVVGNEFNFTARWSEDSSQEVANVFINLAYTYVPKLGSSEPLIRTSTRIKNLNQYTLIGTVENTKDVTSASLVGDYNNLSSEMNRYLITARADANANFSNDDLIPNFTEPQPVFTNLTGGVGIFAGFTQGQSRIKIK